MSRPNRNNSRIPEIPNSSIMPTSTRPNTPSSPSTRLQQLKPPTTMPPTESLRRIKENSMRFDLSALLTITVGTPPHTQTFPLHEGILTTRSAFFARAMSGPWVEKTSRTINLPTDDPDTFATYVNLLYMHGIYTNTHDGAKNDAQLGAEYARLTDLYILCEKLQDTVSKNATMAALVDVAREKNDGGLCCVPGCGAVKAMYEGTPQASLGRMLMADLFAGVDVEFLVENREVLPKDLFVDLALVLMRRQKSGGAGGVGGGGKVSKGKGVKGDDGKGLKLGQYLEKEE